MKKTLETLLINATSFFNYNLFINICFEHFIPILQSNAQVSRN